MSRPSSLLLVLVAGLVFCTTPSAHGQLVLFPNSTQTVVDNGFGDTNLAIGTISVVNQPVPDVTGAASPLLFTGDIIANYVGPTNVQAGSASLTITNAFVTNSSATARNLVGSTPDDPTDYVDMLEWVFFTHPTLAGPGSITTTIDGNLGQLVFNNLVNPPSNTTTDQQLRLGGSHTQFNSNSTDFAVAHWIRPPGTFTAPIPMNASGSVTGNYALGPGTLQVHIDDALVLGPNDTMEFPNSIELEARGSVIPEPATAVMLLGAALCATRRRRGT